MKARKTKSCYSCEAKTGPRLKLAGGYEFSPAILTLVRMPSNCFRRNRKNRRPEEYSSVLCLILAFHHLGPHIAIIICDYNIWIPAF